MKDRAIFLIIILFMALFMFSCGGEDKDSNTDGDFETETDILSDGDSDAEKNEADSKEIPEMEPEAESSDLDGDADIDFIETEIEPEEDIEKPDPSVICEELGLPVREFDESGSNGSALYDIATDFTIKTSAEMWNFKENWSGCENYLFIQDKPAQTNGWITPLWSRDAADLLERLPQNTHIFFVSYKTSSLDIMTAMSMIKTQVDEYKLTLDAEAAASLTRRIHYVYDPARELEGWLGTMMKSPGWGVGIDRFQQIRYIGSYADYNRYDSGQQWFAPNLKMAANEAIYYNYEAEREERIESRNDLVVTLFDNEMLEDPSWAGVKGYVEVELPSAEEMAEYDSLELDLFLGCHGSGEYGTCPAWDYIAYLYLCDREAPDTCDTEFGRWITTYHREGRWVHDVSALLPLIAEGGNRRFAFYTTQKYDVTLKLRFFNGGKDARPYTSIYLFSGGTFNATYNDKYAPLTIAIPEETTKVELATIISGHGMAMPGNCAEFCNTTHSFWVNENENTISFAQAGTSQGCMDMIEEGTIPNQYGTWWYGRSGWCPGKEVPVVMTDITDQVTIGADNIFEYGGLYNGNPYTVDGAEVRMESWLVFSK